MGRILAIGDIHGCLTALNTLLAEVNVQPDDTLVTLGDYCDRGPDTKGVLDRLITLSASHHLVALRGNHDALMLAARSDFAKAFAWKQVGGMETLDSYGSLTAVPDAHWQFLETQCVDYWETETHIFVHGGVFPNLPLAEQPVETLHWKRFENVEPHESGKVMICGHTSQKNGLPRDLGHAICIDTWAYGDGWLSCLDVGTGDVWQADEMGRVWRFNLDEIPGAHDL